MVDLFFFCGGHVNAMPRVSLTLMQYLVMPVVVCPLLCSVWEPCDVADRHIV